MEQFYFLVLNNVILSQMTWSFEIQCGETIICTPATTYEKKTKHVPAEINFSLLFAPEIGIEPDM